MTEREQIHEKVRPLLVVCTEENYREKLEKHASRGVIITRQTQQQEDGTWAISGKIRVVEGGGGQSFSHPGEELEELSHGPQLRFGENYLEVGLLHGVKYDPLPGLREQPDLNPTVARAYRIEHGSPSPVDLQRIWADDPDAIRGLTHAFVNEYFNDSRSPEQRELVVQGLQDLFSVTE